MNNTNASKPSDHSVARAILAERSVQARIDAKATVSQAQLDRVMSDHADTIDDDKVMRADGTIDGAKLIEEMFGC